MDQENYTNINIFRKVYENREIRSCNNMIEQPSHQASNKEHAKGGFNPYVNNQGTTVGKKSTKHSINQILQPSLDRTFA